MSDAQLFLMTVSCTLAMTGCAAPPAAPAASKPAGVHHIEGQVVDWNRSGGTIVMPTVGTATTLTPSGRFHLALPAASTITPHLAPARSEVYDEEGCSGGITSSNEQARGFTLAHLTVHENETRIKDVEVYTVNVTENTSARFTGTIHGVIWIYVDRPTALTGTVQCVRSDATGSGAYHATLAMSLIDGWNIVSVTGAVTATRTTEDKPAFIFSTKFENGEHHVTTWTDRAGSAAALAATNATAREFWKAAPEVRFFGR